MRSVLSGLPMVKVTVLGRLPPSASHTTRMRAWLTSTLMVFVASPVSRLGFFSRWGPWWGSNPGHGELKKLKT